MKRNKGVVILTAIVLLLPMVIGLILWNELPDQIPMHWNIHGEVDAWGSKGEFVFLVPLIFVGLQFACLLAASASKEEKVTKKVSSLILWLCPIISILTNTLIYMNVFGYDFSAEIILPLSLGVILTVIGNWLPKIKRNSFIGIKVPWALKDDENWYHTHRFAGKVWVIGGIVLLLTALAGTMIITLIVSLIAVALPTVYSYILYRKQNAR